MASGTLGSSLKHLRDLFGGGTAVGLGDGELLRAIRRLARRTGLRGPGGAAWSDGRGDLPGRPARSSRCGRRVPGHVPRPGPQGRFAPRRRRPGRLAASRGLSRGGPAEHRGRSGGGGTSRRHRRWMSRMPARAGLDFDLSAILHEEIDRLPDSHRAAGRPLRPGGPDLRAGRRPPAMDRADPLPPAGQGPEAAARPARPTRRDRGRRGCRAGTVACLGIGGGPVGVGAGRGGGGDRRADPGHGGGTGPSHSSGAFS